MRAMVLEFPDDPACWQLDRQYMLGESMLVAPIFNKEGNAQYYLPAGTWTHFLSGETVVGGSWRNENHSYMSLPLMVRQNSIIAVGSVEDKPDYDYASDIELHIFELKEGTVASTTVHNTEGEQELKLTAIRSGNVITLDAFGSEKPWKAVLRGIFSVMETNGASLTVNQQGVVVTPENGVQSIKITLIGDGSFASLLLHA